jgi:hypothetical protein
MQNESTVHSCNEQHDLSNVIPGCVEPASLSRRDHKELDAGEKHPRQRKNKSRIFA